MKKDPVFEEQTHSKTLDDDLSAKDDVVIKPKKTFLQQNNSKT